MRTGLSKSVGVDLFGGREGKPYWTTPDMVGIIQFAGDV